MREEVNAGDGALSSTQSRVFISNYMWDFPNDNARSYPEDNPPSDFYRVDHWSFLVVVFLCV